MRIIFVCLFFGTAGSIFATDLYKMYCLYTPQFQTLYEESFLPSIKDTFEIVVHAFPQECPTGMFQSEGWDLTMLRKLELLRQAILENWNHVFFYSDIDIIFLQPILETCIEFLGENDFIVQQGWPRDGICAGFFVMKGNDKNLKLIESAYELLKDKMCMDDQTAIQTLLDTPNNTLRWEFLPPDQFANGRKVLKEPLGLYSKESELVIHDSLKMFHANCCIGLENKYHFIHRVQNIYSSNKGSS